MSTDPGLRSSSGRTTHSSPGLEPLAPGPDAAAFLTMTFPTFWSRLLARSQGLPLVALAAWNEKPLGLALAEVLPGGVSARLLSLFVQAGHRNQGIGTLLLQELESTLRQNQIAEVYATYTQGRTGTLALEKVLRGCGWSPPEPSLLLVWVGSDAVAALNRKPTFRRRPLPEGFSYGLWKDLTEAERAEVRDWSARGVVPAYLNPFGEADLVDARYSLTLRHEGRLLGFLIAHRIAPQSLRFTCLFVHPAIPLPGLGLYLTLEGVHRYVESEAHQPGYDLLCATYVGTPLAEFWHRHWLTAVPEARVTRSLVSGKHLGEQTRPTDWQTRTSPGDLLAE